jgi:hypothetical protein
MEKLQKHARFHIFPLDDSTIVHYIIVYLFAMEKTLEKLKKHARFHIFPLDVSAIVHFILFVC